MSDDDFGTISVRRGERAREIEVMRQHYRKHRETLLQMAADAPTETLAEEYQRLVDSIDGSLAKLDELDGRAAATVTQHQKPVSPVPPAPAIASPLPSPMARPLNADPEATQPHYQVPEDDPYATPGGTPGNSRAPIIGIVIAGLVVLAVIGWLLLRSTDNERPSVDDAVISTAETAPDTTADTAPPVAATQAPEPAGALTIRPASLDYGVIRKGTRASRQYEVTNNGDDPVTIQVARSTCRCLYYEYEALIPPKGKETITITIDGARAPAGALREAIAVTGKNAPDVRGELVVEARIQ